MLENTYSNWDLEGLILLLPLMGFPLLLNTICSISGLEVEIPGAYRIRIMWNKCDSEKNTYYLPVKLSWVSHEWTLSMDTMYMNKSWTCCKTMRHNASLAQRKRVILTSKPNMNDCDSGTWTQVALDNIYHFKS